jgi:DNA repair exonuclease SbcCD ATPase subunit
MATQNTTTYNVEVTDGGSTEKVISKIETLIGKLKNAQNEAKQGINTGGTTGSRSLSESAMSGSTYGKLRATGVGTGAAARDFAKESQGLGGLVRLYATYAANVFAVSAAFNALSRAMDTTNMISSMNQLGASTGRSLGTVSKNLVDLTDGAISLRDSMQAVAKMSSAGIANKDIERLGLVAKNASLSLGISLPDALDRLGRGVTKLEPELLDELGLFTKIGPATEAYARSIGKAVGSLTDFERRQAFSNAVIKEGEEKFSALGDAVNVNPYNKLLASLQNLAQNGLELVNKLLVPLVDILSQSPVALTAAVSALGVALVKQALPALGQFKQGLADAAASTLETKTAKAADAELAKLKQTESIKAAAEVRAEAQVDKLVAAEKRLQNLKDAGLIKLKKAQDILAKDLDDINDKDLAYFQRKADRAKNPAEKQGWMDVKQAIVDTKAANDDYTKTVAKNEQDIAAERANSFSVYGANVRAAAAAEKDAEKARIISNANQQASLVGIRDGWKLLNAEIANSSQDFNVLEKGMLRVRGAFAVLVGAASAFGTAISTALNVVGTIIAVFTLADAVFSKNAKQMADYSSAIDSAEESVANVTRTVDILYRTTSGNSMSIKGINALANAFQELAKAAEDAVRKTATAKETMGWWEKLGDNIASGFGGGVDKKLAGTLTSQILSSFKILDSAGMGEQARSQLKATLGVENLDFESVRLAVLKLGTDGVKPTIDKLLELSRELSNVDSRTQKFKSTIESTNKSYQDYLISVASKDPLFKLGQNVNDVALAMLDLKDNGILGVAAALDDLGQSPEKTAFFGPDFTKQLLAIKDNLNADIKALNTYKGALQDVNKAIEKFEENDAFKSNQQAVASGYLSQKKADELAGPEYAGLKQTKSALEAQIKVTADSKSFKDAQTVFTVGVDAAFKKGSELIQTALKNGAELNAVKIAQANAQGLTGERKAEELGKLAQQELNIRIKTIKSNIDLMLNQDRLIAAIEENSAQTALDTASREGKLTQEAVDRLAAAQIVSKVLAEKTKSGIPNFQTGIDKAIRETTNDSDGPTLQARAQAELKLGQRQTAYSAMQQAVNDLAAEQKIAQKGTAYAKISGRAEDEQRVLALQGEIRQIEEQRAGLRNNIVQASTMEMVLAENLTSDLILRNKQDKENVAIQAAIATARESTNEKELQVQLKLQGLILTKQKAERDLKGAQDRQKILQAQLELSNKTFETEKATRDITNDRANAQTEIESARISGYVSLFTNSKQYTNSLQDQNELQKISQDYTSKLAEENASIAQKREQAQKKIAALSAGETDAVEAITEELKRQETLSKNAVTRLEIEKDKRKDILEITKQQRTIQLELEKIAKRAELQKSQVDLQNTIANNALEAEELRLEVQKAYAREFDIYVVKQQNALQLKKAELATIQQIRALETSLATKKEESKTRVVGAILAGGAEEDIANLQMGETEYLTQQTTLTDNEITKQNLALENTKAKLAVQQQLTLEQIKYNEMLSLSNELSTTLKNTFGLFGDKVKAVGEALGDTVTRLTESSIRQEKFSKAQIEDEKKLNDLKGDSGADEQSIIDLQNKMADDKKKNNKEDLKGDLAAISSTKKMFKEKTAAYKIFAAVEKALAIAQVASNAMVLASKLTTEAGSTAATTAGTASRMPAYITDIWGQTLGKLPPPFGAIVGAGLVALLLSSFGGKGGSSKAPTVVTPEMRQETAGTAMGYNEAGQKVQVRSGVFGDENAKSNSIDNSLKIIADNSVDGLEYDNKMLNALRNLKGALEETAKALFGVGGLRSGSAFGTMEGSVNVKGGTFNTAMNTLTFGLWGGKKSVSTDIIDSGIKLQGTFLELTRAGGGVIQNFETIKTTTTKGKKLGLFGGGSSSSVDTFYADLAKTNPAGEKALRESLQFLGEYITTVGEIAGKSDSQITNAMSQAKVNEIISLRGLTGEDFDRELQVIFSALLDDTSQVLFAEFKKFSKFGEGLAETVTRVVDNNTKVNQAVKNIGGSDLKGTNDITEALIKAAGGLDKFLDKAEDFRSNFLTEAEQLEPINKAYRKGLTDLGLSADISREELKGLIQNFDLLNPAAGRAGKSTAETYTLLLDIASGFDKVADAAESAAKKISDERDGLKRKLDELTLTAEQLRDIDVSKLDASNQALQRQVFAMQDMQTAAKTLQTRLNDVTKTIKSQITSLSDYKQSLIMSDRSPLSKVDQLQLAKAQQTELFQIATSTTATEEERTKAFDKFRTTSDQVLTLGREVFASGADYQVLYTGTMGMIDALGADLETRKTAAETQLETLQSSNNYLKSIEQTSLSTSQLIGAYLDSIKTYNTAATAAGGNIVGIPKLASGTNYVPYDMLAQIHQGERIIPAADNQQLMNNNMEMVQEIRLLNQRIGDLEQAIIEGAVINAQATDRNTETLSTAIGATADRTIQSARIQTRAAIK